MEPVRLAFGQQKSFWGGSCKSIPSHRLFEGKLAQEEMVLEEKKGKRFGRNSEPPLQSKGPFRENTKMSLTEGSSVGRWDETHKFGIFMGPSINRTSDGLVGVGERENGSKAFFFE